MSFFKDKTILIIGGTGTIGIRLIKELEMQQPKVIRIFSRDEYKQFVLAQQLSDRSKYRFLIGDVRDPKRVHRAMDGVDVVFNLAGMKHVQSCEYNPSEAIQTNVNGMQHVIDMAMQHNVECVIFTSSDKAINPSNTYGATKLLAEKLVQAANFNKGKTRTRFIAVRFGNVMGSRGSVIPLFKEQMQTKQSITVTDPSMTRFMMSGSQAVELIMRACEVGVGGETFVLKMPVVALRDLCTCLIEAYCEEHNSDPSSIQVHDIGLRAGERVFEELMTVEESVTAYDLKDMYSVLPLEYINLLKDHYLQYPKAVEGSYHSDHQTPITLDEVRELLIQDGWIRRSQRSQLCMV